MVGSVGGVVLCCPVRVVKDEKECRKLVLAHTSSRQLMKRNAQGQGKKSLFSRPHLSRGSYKHNK